MRTHIKIPSATIGVCFNHFILNSKFHISCECQLDIAANVFKELNNISFRRFCIFVWRVRSAS
uniref:Uncharacterized protein n=1 Tax=Ascaris lumbricoides TaxID=6252 RepID=A0A0M3HIM6_ASCLU